MTNVSEVAQVQIEKQQLEDIIVSVVKATISELGIGKVEPKQEKSAYQKTELLLYNYTNFQRVIKEKMEQINEIKKHGVPKRGEAVHSYNGGSSVSGLVTDEETIDNAVHVLEQSVAEVQVALDRIDLAMKCITNDPWYKILEYRYFDGMNQEDIAKEFNCMQPNISKHRSRLIRELSMRLFPNDVVKEMLN